MTQLSKRSAIYGFTGALKRQFTNTTVIFTLLIVAVSSHANNISNNNASVEFSGEHAGMTFSGEFEKWQGSIVFPPNENANIDVNFDLSSAKTGDFTYDSTLPEGDWFDVENHPTGRFVSSSVKLESNQLFVEGMLTLKGKSKKETFSFQKKGKHWLAELPIDRLEYEIGTESDPDAEWVSRDINLTIKIPVKY